MGIKFRFRVHPQHPKPTQVLGPHGPEPLMLDPSVVSVSVYVRFRVQGLGFRSMILHMLWVHGPLGLETHPAILNPQNELNSLNGVVSKTI